MNGKLEFNLPEEDEEYKRAVHAMDMYCVLWDFDQKLRGWLKYGHTFKTADEVLEKTRDYLFECMNERNVNL